MRRNSMEFCKKGITIVTEDADSFVYTIIARHIEDVIRDWQGPCDFLPTNDAQVHYAVYNGEIIQLPQNCDMETMMSILMACRNPATAD